MISQNFNQFLFKTILFIFASVFCSMGSYAQEPTSVKIIVENYSSKFSVEPYVEVFGEPLRPFVKTEGTKFEYLVPRYSNKWFIDINVKLIWRGADIRNKGKKTDFEQRISLKIRQTFPNSFTIPVFYDNNRTHSEMLRLENQDSINDQFQVYFRSYQIVTYFREVSGSDNASTRRAAKLFFDSAVRLAQQPDYIINFSEDAQNIIEEIYQDSKSYQASILGAKSMYWRDINLVSDLIKSLKCKETRKLLDELTYLKDSDRKSYLSQFPANSMIIDEKIKMLDAECKDK